MLGVVEEYFEVLGGDEQGHALVWQRGKPVVLVKGFCLLVFGIDQHGVHADGA